MKVLSRKSEGLLCRGVRKNLCVDYALKDLKALLQAQPHNAPFTGLGVVLPLSSICTYLKGINYDGPRPIELFRPEYWAWGSMPLKVKADRHKRAISLL
jgi:hypothetical protein